MSLRVTIRNVAKKALGRAKEVAGKVTGTTSSRRRDGATRSR